MNAVEYAVKYRLTNEIIDTFGLFFPVHSQEVDRHTSEHDNQTHSTHYRLWVKTEPQQKGPEQQVADWHKQVYLWVQEQQRWVWRTKLSLWNLHL